MSTLIGYRRPSALERLNPWEQFTEWVASTQNGLYIGWFGVLMIPISQPTAKPN